MTTTRWPPVLDETWQGETQEFGRSVVPGCATGFTATTAHEHPDGRAGSADGGRGPRLREPQPAGGINRAHLKRLISRIQVLQLDSVSVAVRAHYAPVFSRLGPYDRDVLDRAAWGHAAPAAVRRVLGARGRADGRRRLAAAALADAPVPARPVGHAHRQGQSATRRRRRRRRRRTRPSTAGQIEAHLDAEPRAPRAPGGIAATPNGSRRPCSPPGCSRRRPGWVSPGTTT